MSKISNLLIKRFPDLNNEAFLTDVESVAKIVHVKEGEIMIDYGDFIPFVPLLLNGLIKVMRLNQSDKEILLYFLSGGDTCASSFSCCMIKKRSEIQAIVEEDSEILAIPIEQADQWLEKHRVWREFVFTNFEQKIFQLIDTVDRLAFSQLDDKLIDYLEDRSRFTNDPVINVTHSAIAHDLNVSREAVSRMLKKMEHQGTVNLGRNTITLNT